MKVYKYKKDVAFNQTGFNAPWVRSHATEAAFVAKCETLKLLSESQAKEVYALATTEVVSEKVPVKDRAK